jgi:hypothetical protein
MNEDRGWWASECGMKLESARDRSVDLIAVPFSRIQSVRMIPKMKQAIVKGELISDVTLEIHWPVN